MFSKLHNEFENKFNFNWFACTHWLDCSEMKNDNRSKMNESEFQLVPAEFQNEIFFWLTGGRQPLLTVESQIDFYVQ